MFCKNKFVYDFIYIIDVSPLKFIFLVLARFLACVYVKYYK